MAKRVDLTGKEFGRLKVVGFGECRKRSDGRNTIYWKCVCQCGQESMVSTANLNGGKVSSCGCLKRERSKEVHTIHGFHSRSEPVDRLYSIWNCMKTRCYNEAREDYKLYGGRGITVCPEWLHDFAEFRRWSLSNHYKDGLTLDRIDVNGNYCPENCRWATLSEQARNKRNCIFLTFNGETKNIADWADELGIKRSCIYSRFKKGYSVDKILSTGRVRSTTTPESSIQ